jgi:hypothetical protein
MVLRAATMKDGWGDNHCFPFATQTTLAIPGIIHYFGFLFARGKGMVHELPRAQAKKQFDNSRKSVIHFIMISIMES